MRADIGDYYCKITDIAGQISLSAHTSVVGKSTNNTLYEQLSTT